MHGLWRLALKTPRRALKIDPPRGVHKNLLPPRPASPRRGARGIQGRGQSAESNCPTGHPPSVQSPASTPRAVRPTETPRARRPPSTPPAPPRPPYNHRHGPNGSPSRASRAQRAHFRGTGDPPSSPLARLAQPRAAGLAVQSPKAPHTPPAPPPYPGGGSSRCEVYRVTALPLASAPARPRCHPKARSSPGPPTLPEPKL